MDISKIGLILCCFGLIVISVISVLGLWSPSKINYKTFYGGMLWGLIIFLLGNIILILNFIFSTKYI